MWKCNSISQISFRIRYSKIIGARSDKKVNFFLGFIVYKSCKYLQKPTQSIFEGTFPNTKNFLKV